MVATNIGVEVTTGLRSGPSNAGTPSGIFHIAGLTERGSTTTATLITSLAQYTKVYGGRTAYSSNMLDTARLFFEEGGSQLLVSRAVGPAATKGALTLMDSMAVPTIKVEAANQGEYSTALSVAVETTDQMFTLTVSDGGEKLAVYRNVTSISELLSLSSSNQHFKISDLGSSTVAPGNNPVTAASAPLPAGSDDRAGVTAQHVITALTIAEDAAAGGAVATPGYSADVIGNALVDYASQHEVVALLAPHAEAGSSEAITLASDLSQTTAGEYAGLFFPHMIIPDGSGTRVVGPEGYIAAVRARAFIETGFWQVPAGDRAQTRWAVGTSQPVSIAKNNELSLGLVNGIITSSGRTRLYNWSSLSQDRANLAMLSARDVLNNLSVQLRTVLEQFVFATLDGRGHLLSQVEAAAIGICAPIAEAGGFYALEDDDDEIDPGYRVVVDSTNNTLETGAQNTVIVDTSVRLSPTAALVKAEIVKVALASAL